MDTQYYEIMDYDENFYVIEATGGCHPNEDNKNIHDFVNKDGEVVFSIPSKNIFTIFSHYGEMPIEKKTFLDIVEANRPFLAPPCNTFTTIKEFKDWHNEQMKEYDFHLNIA
jgi:hypothetical protein